MWKVDKKDKYIYIESVNDHCHYKFSCGPSSSKKNEKEKYIEIKSSTPVGMTGCRSTSFTLGKATYNFVLIVRRIAGSVLGDAMFFHITSVSIEEHVVYLLLVLRLQLFLLNGEPHPKLLQLLSQPLNLLLDLILIGLHHLPLV